MSKRPLVALLVVALVFTLTAAPALSQFGQSTGSIHGRVTDESGGILFGVTVAIKGPGAPRTLLTDSRGEFHAINLSPATYRVTLDLQGFATVNRENVAVEVGRDTELTIQMALSPATASVTVSSETPRIDTRKVQTGAQVTNAELDEIPTARDPWVVLQTIPGVMVDRVNVAGSESGQQSTLQSKGSVGGTFQVDGVNMTDMIALGSSMAYYDFDSFQEMQVITGGGDASVQGASVHMNMITKRGTNDLHGSARIYDADHHFQSTNLPPEAEEQEASGLPLGSGNRIDQIQDYGLEAGGPIWRDHIWLWGAYGRDQINLITAGDVSDKTTLEDTNFKLNAQIVPENSLELWYLRSDKLKFGRGAGPTHPQPTTLDQTTPGNTWKIQDSHVFSSSVFASLFYSGQNGNYVLTPEGGLSAQAFLDADGVWHNSFFYGSFPQTQRQIKGDVSYFFNTGSVGHELKAGFSYLKAATTSHTSWPGDGSNALAAQTYGDLFDCGIPCAVITREGKSSIESKYYGYFLADTLTAGSLTVNVGVRYDKQYGDNQPSTARANPTFGQILPTLNYPGAPGGFTWKNWEPRVGLTYALGSARATVFKASYARYAQALGMSTIAATNPVAFPAYAYYAWNDANGDNLVQPNEVDLTNFQYGINYNAGCPSCVESPLNRIDPNLKAPTTDEFIAGIDRELLPAFAVGVAYTYRKFKNILSETAAASLQTYDPTTGTLLTSGDYSQYTTIVGTLPNGAQVSAPVYRINADVLARLGGAPSGFFTYNRSNYDQSYSGIELTLNKRLADRWMMRGGFVYQTNTQHTGSGACVDPTNIVSFISGQECADGNAVGTAGKGGRVFLNAKWQFNVMGLYQLPAGFSAAANVFGRQGYPINYYVLATQSGADPNSDGLARSVAVAPSDSYRYNNVYEVDLRAEKALHIASNATLTLSVDCFNVANGNTVLQRQNRIGTWHTDGNGAGSFTPLGTANSIIEIQSPRVLRFGARVAF